LCKWAGKNSVSLCPVAWLEQLPSGPMYKRTHYTGSLHRQQQASYIHKILSIALIIVTVHREQVITV